jgi:hypothetical protein
LHSQNGKLKVMRGVIATKVLLSNRQYAALRLFTDERSSYVMGTDNALLVDQRSFGSLFHRGYIRYEKARGGFAITSLGKRARQAFDETDIFRKQPATTFSSYIRTIKALTRTA